MDSHPSSSAHLKVLMNRKYQSEKQLKGFNSESPNNYESSIRNHKSYEDKCEIRKGKGLEIRMGCFLMYLAGRDSFVRRRRKKLIER